MEMNVPNKLTLLRVIMIPFFVWVLMFGSGLFGVQTSRYIATALFVIASATDALDGHIARRDNLVTNFGKFMDPIADKMLVAAALICLVQIGDIGAIAVILIICREFIISGFRLIASDNGIVIAASKWGKMKTIVQMFMIVYFLLGLHGPTALPVLYNIGTVIMWVAVILTVVSAVDYIVKNIDVLKN